MLDWQEWWSWVMQGIAKKVLSFLCAPSVQQSCCYCVFAISGMLNVSWWREDRRAGCGRWQGEVSHWWWSELEDEWWSVRCGLAGRGHWPGHSRCAAASSSSYHVICGPASTRQRQAAGEGSREHRRDGAAGQWLSVSRHPQCSAPPRAATPTVLWGAGICLHSPVSSLEAE